MDAGRGRRSKTLLNAHQVLSIQDSFHPKDSGIVTSVRMLDSGSEGHLYYVEEPYDIVVERMKEALTYPC
jgi:hypothetical protein